MAEELKENEETKEETSEETKEDTSETIESASTVETDPVVEDRPNIDLVQLEQRITSLEQRLLSVETPQPTETPETQPTETPEEETSEEESSDVESTEDIKKILDL